MRCVAVEVEIGRTLRPADFESKSARARITYMLPEDEMVIDADKALREAFDVAQAHVCERLGLKVPAKVILEVEMRIAEPAQNIAPEVRGTTAADAERMNNEVNEKEPELTRGQKAAKTRAENKVKKAEAAVRIEERSEKAAAPDPDEIPMGGADAKLEDAALVPAEKPAVVDPAAVVEEDAPTTAMSVDEVVEDAMLDVVQLETGDLIKAVSKKVVEMQENGVENASDKVKKTINSFNPNPGEPFKIPQIPADQRQKFLDTLKLM